MSRLENFLEKIIISLLVSLIVQGFKLLLSLAINVPDLSLHLDQHLVIGPPTFSIIVTTVLVYILVSAYLSPPFTIWNWKLGRVCRQFRFFARVYWYASNGTAKYEFCKRNGFWCVRIELLNLAKEYGSNAAFTSAADCGVIFLKDLARWPFMKGFQISDKKMMTFEIAGERGGENVGLGMKNTNGHEYKVTLTKFMTGPIEKDCWRRATVDLDEYRDVTKSLYGKTYLEDFSIFTNANLAKDKVVVYVRCIEFS